jgi:hypothetical protein
MFHRSLLIAACIAVPAAALAQSEQRAAPPPQPSPTQTIPERIDPQPVSPPVPETERPGETLSEQMGRTDGVLRPPQGVSPNMPVIDPPDTGTTPVIPPPAAPRNPPPLRN